MVQSSEPYDVIIFGGGIAGLTIAHELINKNLKILIVEKDSVLGGMAKSRREKNGYPSEHSWRGFGPFYKNTFDMLKRIPVVDSINCNTSTVFDNLTGPIDFHILRSGPDSDNYKPRLSVKDKIIIAYIGLKYLLSNHRKQEYYNRKIEPIMKKYLSKDGYDYFINFLLGPGFGMEKKDASVGHVFRVLILGLLNKSDHIHYHKSIDDYHTSNKWHIMNGPTSEVWIDPWVEYLMKNGVEFMLNTELVSIIVAKEPHTRTHISEAIVKKKGDPNLFVLKAHDYVMAINPFNAVQVFKNSNTVNLYNIFHELTCCTHSNQISFRIGLHKHIKYPVKHIGFVMNDSEFNITWYPQEKFWKKPEYIESLWSGTLIDSVTPGKLYNKCATELTIAELKTEIVSQILKSDSFQKLIFDNNGFYVDFDDIAFVEVWYEWKYDGTSNNLKQDYKKWVNTVENEQHKPSQETEYSNLFLAGAHTKTSIGVWSMEGATESGKLAASLILKHRYNDDTGVYYYKHQEPWIARIIQKIDDALYAIKLPNVVIVLVFLVIMSLLIVLCTK